ncbi:MAG: NAD(P)/FAD-dependent oxidoreductase [Promethearchaeota archaeon]
MIKDMKCEAIVIGAGPAGLTAAIYLKRANVDVLLIKGKVKSALTLAHEIDNYPGLPGISGPKLLEMMEDHVKSMNIRIIQDDVIALTLMMKPKMVSTKSAIITGDVVIIATGKGSRKPVMEHEEKYIGLGVSYCAVCDGPLYRGRSVTVLGDDDEAAEDILVLDQMGCKVTWLLKKKKLSETKIEPKKIEEIKEKNIPIWENVDDLKLVADNLVKGLEFKDDQGNPQSIETHCVFVLTSIPTARLLQQAGCKVSERNTLIVDKSQQTNIEGVYGCGDICGNGFQVSISVGEGAVAGLIAARYLRELKK